MEKVKAKRLRKEQRVRIKQRLLFLQDRVTVYSKGHPEEIVPGPSDLCNMPRLKAIIEDQDPEAFMTKETFTPIVDELLPALCHKWRRKMNRELLELMPPAASGNTDDEARLSQATTFFLCRECSEPISYPRILVHGCLTRLRQRGIRNRPPDEIAVYTLFGKEPWNVDHNRVSFHAEASASARLVLGQSGLHRTAAASYVDKKDPWVECVRCLDNEKGRAVYRWRRAVRYLLTANKKTLLTLIIH
jgi:hypothetical protein